MNDAGAVLEDDPRRVADAVAGLARRRRVERDLVGAVRGAGRPGTRSRRPAAGPAPTLEPRVGAPPGWIGSPCLSRISAKPLTPPSATSTPGISRDLADQRLVERALLALRC